MVPLKIEVSQLRGLFFSANVPSATDATNVGGKRYKMVLYDKAEWQFSEREKEAIEVFYTR